MNRFKNWIKTLFSVRIYLIIFILTLLHIVPIWAFKYIPSQDGISHVENSYMLLHYFDADRAYSHYYDINTDPVPNWFSHVTLASLMLFVSPLIAEKILLTAYVILFVTSVCYFITAVDRGKLFLSLLAFPFIYSYLLHLGLYNFCFSFVVMFLCIGYWWRRRDRWNDWKVLLQLNILLIFLYFCHMVSQPLAIISILFLALLHNRTKVYKTLLLAVALTPSYILPFYYVTSRGTERFGYGSASSKWSNLVKIKSLASFDIREYQIGLCLTVLFAVLILYTIVREKIEIREKRLRLRISMTDGFFVLTVFCLLLYFYMPNYMSQSGLITDRLMPYPFIMILPWLSSRLWRPVKYLAGTVVILLVLIHLGFITYYYSILNDELDEYNSAIRFIGKNETVLPISFDYKGKSEIIEPFNHAAGYYCIANGSIELSDYEARLGYFPLKYKPSMDPFAIIGAIYSENGILPEIHPEAYPETIDYILLWSSPDEFPALEWIKNNYKIIYTNKRLKLYKYSRDL